MNILIVMYICGAVDTIIYKPEDGQPIFTHTLESVTPKFMEDLMKLDHTVIEYHEDRGTCV